MYCYYFILGILILLWLFPYFDQGSVQQTTLYLSSFVLLILLCYFVSHTNNRQLETFIFYLLPLPLFSSICVSDYLWLFQVCYLIFCFILSKRNDSIVSPKISADFGEVDCNREHISNLVRSESIIVISDNEEKLEYEEDEIENEIENINEENDRSFEQLDKPEQPLKRDEYNLISEVIPENNNLNVSVLPENNEEHLRSLIIKNESIEPNNNTDQKQESTQTSPREKQEIIHDNVIDLDKIDELMNSNLDEMVIFDALQMSPTIKKK